MDPLTKRQKRCMTLHIRGWTTVKIGEELGISQPMVVKHLRRARAKLGLEHPAPRLARGIPKVQTMDPAVIDQLDPSKIRAAV